MILSTLNNISVNDQEKEKEEIDELAFLVLETDQNLDITILWVYSVFDNGFWHLWKYFGDGSAVFGSTV